MTPYKTGDLNLSVFSMITCINELTSERKHIPYERKYNFDVRNKTLRLWNPENGKCLASLMDDLIITSDEVIKSYDEEIKAILTK